jgi:thiol-disulfide isomerase/thioredoxin
MAVMAVTFAVSCTKEKPKEVVVNAVPTINNEMPALNATMTDSSKVFFKDLDGKVLLVMFNPDCDHCQREAQMFAENKNILDGYEAYFLSPDPMINIAKFATDYKLVEPNIHFGKISVTDVIQAVGPINQVPTFFVYKDKRLVSRNEGELSLEKIRELLK